MKLEEIGQVATWAVNVADEYRVEVSKVTQLYKAMRKYHSAEKAKNIIEREFALMRDIYGRD